MPKPVFLSLTSLLANASRCCAVLSERGANAQSHPSKPFAQDPIIFAGSVRGNLGPYGDASYGCRHVGGAQTGRPQADGSIAAGETCYLTSFAGCADWLRQFLPLGTVRFHPLCML